MPPGWGMLAQAFRKDETGQVKVPSPCSFRRSGVVAGDSSPGPGCSRVGADSAPSSSGQEHRDTRKEWLSLCWSWTGRPG